MDALANLRFGDLLDSLFDGAYLLDMDRRITYWNRGAERISGYPRSEVLGRPCAQNVLVHVDADGNRLCDDRCPVHATLQDGREREAEVFLLHRDGHRVPVTVRVAPIMGPEGKPIGAFEIFSDAASRTRLLDRVADLERQAMMDALTELPNRRFLDMVLASRFQELERYDRPFGLLIADIDHFKAVNDTWGHDVGDRVLRMVAQSLKGCVREFDVVGRWGGEEFVVIAVNVGAPQLAAFAERLRAVVATTIATDGDQEIRVTISLGGALAYSTDDAESIWRRADEQLYVAKEAGRNRVSVG